MAHPLTEGLNPNQALAVETVTGPVMVLAGPGSGKTRVLTHRIAYLIAADNVPPYRIMATTFTNKAASEMRERVEHMGFSVRGMMLGTFHSICAQILRRESDHLPYTTNFTIYDSADQRALVKSILEALGMDTKQHNPYDILNMISAAKNEFIGPESYLPQGYKQEVAGAVYRQYMRTLQANNAMDFDDLLMQTALLFKRQPDVLQKYQEHYPNLMVDEFQDTNMVQYELIRQLAAVSRNLFIVGDPDQSIYAFRGADYRNLKRFEQDFPEHVVISLDENYRSHQIILDAAMAIIRRDPTHRPRDLFSQRKDGDLIQIHQVYNAAAEGVFIAEKIGQLQNQERYQPRDFAVMYRTNAQSRIIENSLIRANIPYRLVGGVRFYDRMEIKDVLAYLHIINNPDDGQRLFRVINVPTRGIGKKSLTDLANWISQRGGGAWDALQYIATYGKGGNVSGRALASIAKFAEMLRAWIDLNESGTVKLIGLLERVLSDVGYIAYIESKGSREEFEDRLENLNALRQEMVENQDLTLAEYLIQNALVADVDRYNPKENAVTLMTLHAAKGLEFPVVFIPGVEDGIMPHGRSKDEPNGIAEERRLMYVGITRAKDRLFLSYAQSRYDEGFSMSTNQPSLFLADLPKQIVEHHSPWGAMARREAVVSPPVTRWRTSEAAPSPKKAARFKAGDMVYHNKYGLGQVQHAIMNEIEEVEVKFMDGITKRLDGDYLTKK